MEEPDLEQMYGAMIRHRWPNAMILGGFRLVMFLAEDGATHTYWKCDGDTELLKMVGALELAKWEYARMESEGIHDD